MPHDIDLPDALEKRDLLAAEEYDEDAVRRLAEAYLDRGSLSDAVNFFDKIADADGLGRTKVKAVETGNTHVLSFDLGRSRHVEVTADDWRRAADNAVRQGKFACAAFGYHRAGDEAKAAEAREKVPCLAQRDQAEGAED